MKPYMQNVLRSVLKGLIVGIVSMSIATYANAESYGFVSSNQADLPPSLERSTDIRSTDPNRPPAYGPEDAKVLVVTFVDFKCPACRRASQSTHQIASQFPGNVRIEFWNNSLPTHSGADILAVASLAAQRQGKFWEMSDLLFAGPREDPATLESYAQELGLDIDQFKSDMNDPALMERVTYEGELAKSLGANNTPGYLINGKLLMGWASWGYLVNLVKRELSAADKLAQQGMDVEDIRDQRAIDNNVDSEMYALYRANMLVPLATVGSE